MSEHRVVGLALPQRKFKENGHYDATSVKMERVEPLLIEPGSAPTRTLFRLKTIEGDLLAGVYSIHVVPNSRAQSKQQYYINQNISGSLNLNQEYIFPYGTRIQIALYRGAGVDDEQEPLRIKGLSPERSLSPQVTLKADRSSKAKQSVRFEDGNGLEIGITMEWCNLNDNENIVVEASVVWVDGKAKIKFDGE